MKLMVFDAPTSAGHVSVRTITLENLPITIGRCRTADLCLNDRWVSRTHCQLRHVDGRVTVRDLGSTHGTYLNGNPVDEALLERGDEIRVGLSCLLMS